MANPDYNAFCYWITVGTLPVGLSSSSDPVYTTLNDLSLSVPRLMSFALYSTPSLRADLTHIPHLASPFLGFGFFFLKKKTPPDFELCLH